MKPNPIRVTTRGVFVPEWGNDSREESDKIRIHFKFLTFAEQQDLLHYDDVGKTFGYESRLVAKMIEKIDNLAVEDESGKVREIKNGQMLVDEPALEKLALETWIHFRGVSALSDEDKKKSQSASNSGSKEKTE